MKQGAGNIGLAEQPLTTLKGVGAALAAKLARLHVYTVQDLLLVLPRDYEDRSRLTRLGGLLPGMSALVEGEVQLADITIGRRRSLAVQIHDGSGSLVLRFYHFHAAQKEFFQRGMRIRAYGEARNGATGMEMYHPEYQQSDGSLPEGQPTLTPIYPLTEGLTQQRMRQLLRDALAQLGPDRLPELLPPASTGHYPLVHALRYVHQPPVDADQRALRAGCHPAQQRLVFEELVAHQLSVLRRRAQVKAEPAWVLPAEAPLIDHFLQQLPFRLTPAQQRVCAEIGKDLGQPHPMLRLVQGDVGSGKTVVAGLAACQALAADLQVALMAPTEILAEQHLANFSRWFAPLGFEPQPLLGRQTGKQRAAALERIASGEARLVIGTHALFQESVQFASLALAIIDEQHRFGVHQRLALRQKGEATGRSPHQLIMTATPIPRTLAMSAYGDLDTSIIDSLPPGRTPIQTLVLNNTRRAEVIDRIRAQCLEGRQAYWVCTLIEESEQLQAQAAEATFAELATALPELRLGLVHGRQKPKEKQAVMTAFKLGQLHLLIATTVIEVGVDVPNASLMVIENAERLGLAQLHQLRGRVGRGTTASFCLLLYQAPLGALGRERLACLRDSTDGFRIAERDLELRGPGEVLGTRQTGLLNFRLADLGRDGHLLPAVQQCASQILANPALALALTRRWISKREQYAEV